MAPPSRPARTGRAGTGAAAPRAPRWSATTTAWDCATTSLPSRGTPRIPRVGRRGAAARTRSRAPEAQDSSTASQPSNWEFLPVPHGRACRNAARLTFAGRGRDRTDQASCPVSPDAPQPSKPHARGAYIAGNATRCACRGGEVLRHLHRLVGHDAHLHAHFRALKNVASV